MNRVQGIRDRVGRDSPEAVVRERTSHAIVFDVPGGKRHVTCSTARLHSPSGVELDTAWGPADAPWDYEATIAEAYRAELTSTFGAAEQAKITHLDSGESISLQALPLSYSNAADQIRQIAIPAAVEVAIGGAEASDDMATWIGAYGAGFDWRFEARTEELFKALRIASLPPNTLGGADPVLQMQVRFAMSSGLEVWINGALWTNGRDGDIADAETQLVIEFKLTTTGETVLRFEPPRTFDAAGRSTIGTYRLKKQGANLDVFHRVPMSWVQSATFPIDVDVTVSVSTVADADDSYATTGATTVWDPISTLCFVGASGGALYFDWFRFLAVPVPRGATIESATFTVEGHIFGNGLGFSSAIFGVASDDAPQISSHAEWLSEHATGHTTAVVAWAFTLLQPGANVSPDISTILQEIVSRSGWAPGQAMALHVDYGSGSNFGGLGSVTGTPATPPTLDFEYTPPTVGDMLLFGVE